MTRPTTPARHSIAARSSALTLAVLTALATMPVSAQSPDGGLDPEREGRVERKGFVIGFGLGAARVTSSASAGPFSVSYAETAVSTDFKIGWAPTDQLLVYWSADGAFRSSSEALETDGISYSGLGGLGATYFLAPGANSFFLTASIGRSSSASFGSDGGMDSISGTGFAIGGGYEFSGHWLVDADLVMNSLNQSGLDGSSQRIIRVGLSWLHY